MGPGEGDRLREIDILATRRLVETGHHPAAPPPDPSAFASFLVAHDVIVAEAPDDTILGFAAGLDLGPLYWLGELAVDPAHARQGIGRALVRAVCDIASARFHRAVGLTTYRDVEFNAAFYRQCGFLTVSRQDHDATLEDRFRAELPAGVPETSRTVMVRWLR